MEDKKRAPQQEYRFKIVEIGGIPYRMPQIRGNQGAFEDRGYNKRAEVYSKPDLEEKEAQIEQCTVDVGAAIDKAFPTFVPTPVAAK